MEKSVLKITNKHQFERMVALLEEHPDVAKGKGQSGCSTQHVQTLWETISLELNSLGPPTRTSREWQRVWIHYKSNLKRKLAANKKILEATGDPMQEICLSPLEQSVVNLTVSHSAVNPLGLEFEVKSSFPASENRPTDEVIDGAYETQYTPSCSKSITRTPERIEEERLQALLRQTKNQGEILETLKKIEKTNYEKYQLEIKKVALLEKQSAEASELHNINMELKRKQIAMLDIQIRSLNLQNAEEADL